MRKRKHHIIYCYGNEKKVQLKVHAFKEGYRKGKIGKTIKKNFP
jgi:hypothetical protein